MIKSYRCKDTERLSRGERVKRFESFERVAIRKLRQLEIATSLNDLRVPPGNMLEALVGDRASWFSIRVNKQFRLCFKWELDAAYDVELVDYH